MNKPVITVKQRRNVTTISLKGSAWNYAVLPNSFIKQHGIVKALLIKADYAKQKNTNIALLHIANWQAFLWAKIFFQHEDQCNG